MCSKSVMVWYLVVMLLAVSIAEASHPQRPEKFTSEEQLRQYLHELKQYYEDNVRIGRFGKRNNLIPAKVPKSYPKQEEPQWKNEYDYYTQFNI